MEVSQIFVKFIQKAQTTPNVQYFNYYTILDGFHDSIDKARSFSYSDDLLTSLTHKFYMGKKALKILDRRQGFVLTKVQEARHKVENIQKRILSFPDDVDL